MIKFACLYFRCFKKPMDPISVAFIFIKRKYYDDEFKKATKRIWYISDRNEIHITISNKKISCTSFMIFQY